jgi:hypothetical protein
LVFTNQNVARPSVVIADQSAGLIASMHTSLPNIPLQFCDWLRREYQEAAGEEWVQERGT